jgi:endonuclease I
MNYKNNMAALLLCTVNHYATADVTNGSFETWLTGSPSGWTTIDSGIGVNKNTLIVQEGLSSAEITVNTSTQGSTDMQQFVSVVSGQSYDFSVWIYHTEGNIKARLYIDGYQGYSDENLVNQWQQITYNFTASTTSDIAVGLRFYDLAGFDGSEIVYVDYFQPTQASGSNSCSSNDVVFSLTTDNYGYETSWTLTNKSNQQVASGNNYESSTSYNESYCLADDDYTFIIDDSYGDGICCTYGNGSYEFSLAGTSLISGSDFSSSETKSFSLDNTGSVTGNYVGTYYDGITASSGYPLKTQLYNLIKDHANQGYSALWTFYENHSLDVYFENDGSILDIYSEDPLSADNYSFTKITDQCGNYSGEGGCYNREHTFPKSWFGGKVEPMNSDVHHIYATDGFVNSKRGGFPFGEVASASFTSTNNSKLGSATTTLGYNGTVFEPIDEFKGDLARAQFYMATRYENLISRWQNNSVYGDAILDGSSNRVFELWQLDMLMRWHTNDPVSQKEIDRNEAALDHQGNRNPFVDHPEYVDRIWGSN